MRLCINNALQYSELDYYFIALFYTSLNLFTELKINDFKEKRIIFFFLNLFIYFRKWLKSPSNK